MILTFFTLLFFLVSSHYLARSIDRDSFNTWTLVLLLEILLSVQFLGVFSILSAKSLFWLGAAINVGIFYYVFRRRWLMRGGFEVRQLYTRKRQIKINEFAPDIGLLVLFLVVTLFNVVTPIAEIDSVGYHLPIVSQMIATGGVWEPFHAGFVGPNTYFPANHEALMVFLRLTFGHLNFAYLITFLGVTLFYGALKAFAKNAPLKREYMLLSVLSIVSIPFLFQQFLNYQIDLFLFGIFGAAIAYLLKAYKDRDKRDLLRFFLLLGLALGTKINALLMGAMLLPVALFVWASFYRQWKQVVWLPFLTFLGGAFWYVRNAVIAGNPFYPFEFTLGETVFKGYSVFNSPLTETSLFHFYQEAGLQGVSDYILQHPDFSGTLGDISFYIFPVVITLMFIGVVRLWLKYLFSNTMRDKQLFARLQIVLLLLIMLFFAQAAGYFFSPYTHLLWHETVRYTSAWLATIPILLVLLGMHSRLLRLLCYGLMISFLVYNLLLTSFLFDPYHLYLLQQKLEAIVFIDFFYVLLFSVVGLGLFFLMRTTKSLLFTYSGLVLVSSLMAITGTLFIFSSQPADDQFLMRELPGYPKTLPHLQVLRQKPKAPIALAGITSYAIFEQEGFSPHYVNIDGCEHCKYADYRDRSVRDEYDEVKWNDLLDTLSIRYLLVGVNNYHNHEAILHEASWAQNQPNRFSLLASENGVNLYEVIR